MKKTGNMGALRFLADPGTEACLLPAAMVERDNSRRIRHLKRALRQGMKICLNPVQREQMQLHYGQGLRKVDIARRQNRTCSAVSKSMKVGEALLRDYICLYMEIYDHLERELLNDVT